MGMDWMMMDFVYVCVEYPHRHGKNAVIDRRIWIGEESGHLGCVDSNEFVVWIVEDIHLA